MTLLIGYMQKQYTLIAADTRTSWEHPVFGHQHTDGNHKIAMSTLGLITGSGYVDALDSVKNELLSKEIKHTDEVLVIINKIALPKINELHKNRPDAKDNTCFLVSYRTGVNDKAKLRVALIHPEWNYKLVYYEDAVTVMPSDIDKTTRIEFDRLVKKSLLKFEDKKEFTDDEFGKELIMNVFKNIMLIAKHFFEIRQHSIYISSDMDCATLLLKGTVINAYGESSEVMNGKVGLSIIPPSSQTRFLTPDIFKEGKQITI